MAASHDIRVDSQFGVDDRATILLLLRRMIEQRSMLEAPVPGGGPGLLSLVLDVDERRDQIVLDASPHAHIERVLLSQPEVDFATRVDKVNVRFTTGPLIKQGFEGMPAYRAPIPERLRYMQRREFFRIEVPPSHGATCQVMVPATANHPPHDIRTRVFDISGGGLSLLVPPGEDGVLTGGARFAACKLSLPESSPILVGLRVRRNFRVQRRGQLSMTCAGCEYLDLTGSAQAVIQRYLMRLDRERIARERGS
jgi:flagellar brake protein